MGLKKYIAASLIFIAVIAGYVFSIAPTNYEATLFGKVFLFPMAVWIVLPLVVLFIASIAHMMFYGLKGYLNTSSLSKDESNMIKLLKNKLLKKEETVNFKNPMFQELGEILSQLELEIKNDSFNSRNSEISALVKDLIDIKNKNFVSTNYRLPISNQIAIANNINKINEEADWAVDVLKKSNEYSVNEVEVALEKVLEDKSMTTLKKVLPTLSLNKKMLFDILKKDSLEEEFSLEKEELVKVIPKVELSKQEYLEIARMYKKSLIPDEIISLFEELSNSNEQALEAYVYVLFEYEMIDKIRDIFASVADEDLTAYKALLELKDSGKQYTLDSISYLN